MTSSPEPVDRIGTLFGGRYLLGGLLGVGGSATVYEAEDTAGRDEYGRPLRVAVKVLHPHLCASPSFRSAFLREAEKAGRLRHRNIASIWTSGVHDAGGMLMAWIALELVPGPTLTDWVTANGPLSASDALTVVDGLLSGLGEAHAAGIVHRDICPGNVILHDAVVGEPLTARMVKIVDFGLADLSGRSTVGADLLLAVSGDLASTGHGVVGSLNYLSPEQARGLPVAATGDLYQAGAVLYFLLTGQPPFPRSTADQVLQAHLSAPPPVPSALAPAARGLDRIMIQALAKEPANRFQTASEFQLALDASEISVPENPWKHVATNDQRSYQRTRVLLAPAPADPHRLAVGPAVPGSLDYLNPATKTTGDTPRPSRSPAGTPAMAVAAIAIAAVVLAAVFSAFSGTGVAARPAVVTTATEVTASPSAAPSSTASSSATAMVVVPTLYGKLGTAERLLHQAGLVLGQVTRTNSAEAAGTVLGQSPAAGAPVASGFAVNLLLASGKNSVPAVSGSTVAAATARLESAGFKVTTDFATDDLSVEVTGSEPSAGTVLRVGVTVNLVVAESSTPMASSPSPTVTASTAPSATP